jgi:hypothetical protein
MLCVVTYCVRPDSGKGFSDSPVMFGFPTAPEDRPRMQMCDRTLNTGCPGGVRLLALLPNSWLKNPNSLAEE